MKKLLLLLILSFSSIASAISGESISEPYPVGELGDRWEFPSDHLPVGGTVGEIHFACWNILNTKYLNHVVDNGQGLSKSFIMTANIPATEDGSLTVRESVIIQDILEMIQHPLLPRSLIALEETSEPVFNALQKVLPAHMQLSPSNVEDLKHGDIFIYDTIIFEAIDLHTEFYKIHPSNTYMTLSLKEKKRDECIALFNRTFPEGLSREPLLAKSLLNP